ncbi:GIY-YIG nuclease family protein [Brachybacterium phenoliresistens]|uniref:GIY-YIG nuclease family protein n=1 Tax=Brachybacterium phenoliresistens TaxID=396014 RepID=UPI0031E38DA5
MNEETDLAGTAAAFRAPDRLTSLADVGAVPNSPGVYGWWFRRASLDVPARDYRSVDGFDLLYVGISPSREASSGNLRKRVRQHVGGDASRSTLRRTLGTLLDERLGLVLALNHGRATYGRAGEAALTEWMLENAALTWVENSAPWLVERELLHTETLALNIDGRNDEFVRALADRRREALRRARLSALA